MLCSELASWLSVGMAGYISLIGKWWLQITDLSWGRWWYIFPQKTFLTIKINLCALSEETEITEWFHWFPKMSVFCIYYILMFYHTKTLLTLKIFHASELCQIPKLRMFYLNTVFHNFAVLNMSNCFKTEFVSFHYHEISQLTKMMKSK